MHTAFNMCTLSNMLKEAKEKGDEDKIKEVEAMIDKEKSNRKERAAGFIREIRNLMKSN